MTGPTGSANVDTNIRLSSPTTTFGTDPALVVGVTNAANKAYRTLMGFNLSNIPAGATITSCKLTVNVNQRTSPTAGHIRKLCSQHWLDGDAQSENQATWNVWKTATGGTWGQAGASLAGTCGTGNADYTTTGEVAFTPPAGTGLFTFPDIKTLCQDAVTQPVKWLRLRISQDSEAVQSHLIKFDSSDVTTAANRPKLTVTWTVP